MAETILAPRLVGDLEGIFWVPSYQRGYRWGVDEVTRLLEDIRVSDGESYYLQPVVVRPVGDQWELIDGQQRLTTLFLILRYIKTHLPTAEIKYSLAYETRAQSAEYLDDPAAERSQENIDFFHIFQASERIRQWFEAQPNPTLAAINFYKALTETVRVIWYESPSDDPHTLFARLNVGRIPLTDAELVKAVLVSKSKRPHEVAAQWDSIERDLRSPELWGFVTGRTGTDPTHISLLLDALSPTMGIYRPLFHTFETLRQRIDVETPDDVWADVVGLHSLVLGWYEDRDVFHKIGYLVATGSRLSSFIEPARTQKRSSFESYLDGRIRTRLALSQSALGDLSYDHRPDKASDVLLLMNVETVRRRSYSSERYSFAAHASRRWSLEHIHAQGAEELNRAEQWSEWLRLHGDALKVLPGIDKSLCEDLLRRIDEAVVVIDKDKFRKLEEEIVGYFAAASPDGEEAVHSITNLALLASDDNSALNNSVFEVKRQEMLRLDRDGRYIPPATRNLFLKYYTGADAQQVHFWGPQDRAAYWDAMIEAVGPYLTPEVAAGA